MDRRGVDRPNHDFQLSKLNCTYTKPGQVRGADAASEDVTQFLEITGHKVRAQGKDVVTMTNGDKVYVTLQSSGTLRSLDLKWTITGGTGKFAGIKGKGASKAKAAADGGTTAVIQGTYTLPK